MLADTLSSPAVTDPKQKAEGYHVCAMLQNSVNEGLNMKAYLKQNLDTAKLFRTVLKIYEYTLLSDSFDIPGRYAKKNAGLRLMHRKNIYSGGKFFLLKSEWSEAYPYFDMFLRTDVGGEDSLVARVAYWATVCAMNENNAEHVVRHVDTAISLSHTSSERAALTEYKARSYCQLGDSTRWLQVLDEAVDRFPGNAYFFLNLMEYYQQHGMTERGVERTDSLMLIDKDRSMYWFALSMFALDRGDYDKCISLSDECISRDSANVDAYYNKGISLLNKALSDRSTTTRRHLYRRALKPMEKVRELLPDAIDKWGNPLYRIYLNLNMGAKFEEIDRLLDERYGRGTDRELDRLIPARSDKSESGEMDKGISES